MMISGLRFALVRIRISWLVRGVAAISDSCRSFFAELWPVTSTEVFGSSSRTAKNNEIGRIMMPQTPNGGLNIKMELAITVPVD
jgi:hypothetical protein